LRVTTVQAVWLARFCARTCEPSMVNFQRQGAFQAEHPLDSPQEESSTITTDDTKCESHEVQHTSSPRCIESSCMKRISGVDRISRALAMCFLTYLHVGQSVKGSGCYPTYHLFLIHHGGSTDMPRYSYAYTTCKCSFGIGSGVPSQQAGKWAH